MGGGSSPATSDQDSLMVSSYRGRRVQQSDIARPSLASNLKLGLRMRPGENPNFKLDSRREWVYLHLLSDL